jgi:hypothetical protein
VSRRVAREGVTREIQDGVIREIIARERVFEVAPDGSETLLQERINITRTVVGRGGQRMTVDEVSP